MDSDKDSLIIDLKYYSNTMNDKNKNFTTATITATDGGRGGRERE